jgi:hypothetical protein
MHNPYNLTKERPLVAGESYRVVEGTLHGSAPPAGSSPPTTRVPDNMIVIMTTAGREEMIGSQVYIESSLYNHLLPFTFKGYPKELVPAIKGFYAEHAASTPPNIVHLVMDGMLNLDPENKLYDHFFYAVEGDEIQNRNLLLRKKDVERPYSSLSVFAKFHTFGVNTLDNFIFEKSPVQDTIMDEEHKGKCTVHELLKLLSEMYKPTPDLPLIFFLVSCDVQHAANALPDPRYFAAGLQRSRYGFNTEGMKGYSKIRPTAPIFLNTDYVPTPSTPYIFNVPEFKKYGPSAAQLVSKNSSTFRYGPGIPGAHRSPANIERRILGNLEYWGHPRSGPYEYGSKRSAKKKIKSGFKSIEASGPAEARNSAGPPPKTPLPEGPPPEGPPPESRNSREPLPEAPAKAEGGRLKTQRRTRKRCQRSKKHRRTGSRKASRSLSK